jgi:hypothetical protein
MLDLIHIYCTESESNYLEAFVVVTCSGVPNLANQPSLSRRILLGDNAPASCHRVRSACCAR